MYRLPGQTQLITVGKMKTKHWKAAQNDYEKRIKRYGKFELNEVKDFVGRGMPDEGAMVREGEALLKKTAQANRIVLVTPLGKQMPSEKLARYWHRLGMEYGRIAFLIGGPLGFSPEVHSAAHEEISLSPMTFTHELARVLLLEQLYRACTILNNEPYHK